MPPTQNFGSVRWQLSWKYWLVHILCSKSFLNNWIDQITVFITQYDVWYCDVWLGEERDATVVGQYIIGNLF